jgi:anti-sigma regulatory factor (Ser/Thr protein kinase)
MIDLDLTRQNMLRDIGITHGQVVEILRDPMAPACVDGDPIRLAVEGHSRDDLFPLLKVVLAARYAHVLPARLTRELLAPLKNGLGNAYKRGNARDRTKTIWVEIDATRRGAVVAITDEGRGFDVAQTLENFQAQTQYFSTDGAGFRTFARTASLVSYADGGRTFLLRFLDDATKTDSTGGSDVPLGEDAPTRIGLDSVRADRWRTALSSSAALSVDTASIYGPSTHDGTLRCILRLRSGAGTMIVSGMPHSSVQAARDDYETARALHAGMHAKKVHIPETLACIEADAVVVYAFDPWMDLWAYIAERDNPTLMARLMERLGVCLTTLHGMRTTDVSVPTEGWDAVCDAWRAAVDRACRFLRTMDSNLEARLAATGASLLQRARAFTPGPMALVHGDFGLHRVHYGVDGRFYLTGFDGCRISHPGRDLGALFADLSLLTNASWSGSKRHKARDNVPESKRPLQDLVLTAYAGNAPLGWEQDLQMFLAGAMIERIACVQSSPESTTGNVLTPLQLPAALACAEHALHNLNAIDAARRATPDGR